MKKLLILGVILTLVMSIVAGCAQAPTAVKFQDGVHTAEGEIDEQGWKGVIEISVKDGAITSVDYNEVNEEGQLKTDDQEYADTMKSVANITPEEAYEILEASLIEKQDVDQVELVSGATSSAEQFKVLAEKALNK
ncbi:MAG: FMN-binding protein [Tissierellia bacterium]|nr:FMN-binding protein [Tissierellia bacterium]